MNYLVSHMVRKTLSQRILFILILLFFIIFLGLPLIFLLGRSFIEEGHLSLQYYKDIFSDQTIINALFNSIKISLLASLVSTVLAFIVAYSIHMTQGPRWLKGYNKTMVLLPMLVPTITYGFILMYLFGNEGVLARILGEAPFEIYGKNGIFLGYVIYTLPAAYFIISNAFNYVDHRFYYISHLMKDNGIRRFYHTLLRPLIVPIANAFVLSFILSFTDFGIPASIGADYNVIATELYELILGSIPKFAEGAVVAVLMLLPAVFGFIFLTVIENWNVRQQGDFHTAINKRPLHDWMMNGVNFIISTVILLIFLIMFIVPFTENYPYKLNFTLEHIVNLFKDDILIHIYLQSLFVAVATAVFGTIICCSSALLTVRTKIQGKHTINIISLITNTVPGMILGLSYLLFFQNTTLQGTFLIVILSIIVHYFTTPFLMAKSALEKLDLSWDITSALMRDSWGGTIFKIILPNMKSTIVDMLSYYFINAMVTISGVIFLVSTSTQIVSTQINQLQHYNRFVDIFILSILIFLTNVIVRALTNWWLKVQREKEAN
ncbi:ABC transporter permease subunit [Staphylococcus auricularis]|nr:ABC transporter permease subunit [Staphylococcus auricularis]